MITQATAQGPGASPAAAATSPFACPPPAAAAPAPVQMQPAGSSAASGASSHDGAPPNMLASQPACTDGSSPVSSCAASARPCSSPATSTACDEARLHTTTSAAPRGASSPAGGREWLYRLIMFPAYFTPCPACCGGARAPKREQLLTQFDTAAPHRVYCSTCPGYKERAGSGGLLQVRRSAFKDVVKAADLARLGADAAGVQQYTLNGSKVLYLNREAAPEKKAASTNAAPAACAVDGRAMMDRSSTYCSLKCKLTAEDAGFVAWLAGEDPCAHAAMVASPPPRAPAAGKRSPQPAASSEDGDDDHASGSGSLMGAGAASAGMSGASSRPAKCARTLSASIAAAACAPASGAAQLQRAASAAAAPPSGLKRIRVSLPGSRRRAPQQQAPRPASALDLDHALSCTATWDAWPLDGAADGLDSPCFTALAAGGAPLAAGDEPDGSMSPALIHAPISVFASGSCDDWGLCGSPLEGGLMSAGMGALIAPGLCGGLGAGCCDTTDSLGRTCSDATTAADELCTLLVAPTGLHCC